MPETDPADTAGEKPEAPERRVAGDIARRGLLAGPPLVLFCALGWGLDGLWSSLLALGLVLLNFLAGAAIIGLCARISPTVLMAGVLVGYFLRLGVITAVVVPIRNADWFECRAVRHRVAGPAHRPVDLGDAARGGLAGASRAAPRHGPVPHRRPPASPPGQGRGSGHPECFED